MSAVLQSATNEAIARAGTLLRDGGLVAFPTETVYGLGADAASPRAVAKIYAAKGRPSFNPLIAHVADIAAAEQEGVFNDAAQALAHAFWPGPLTLVVPLATTASVCDLARAGLDSVALRVPANDVARALIEAAGRPVAAPSANRSGHVSPTAASHVVEDLGDRIDMILDGGPTRVGVESTIVSCLGDTPRLLRPGGASREAIRRVLGFDIASDAESSARPLAPGMLASHYAPRAKVRLNACDAREGEAVLDFGGQLAVFKAAARIDLSPSRDLVEAATNLFGALRMLDASGARAIAVAPIPDNGLGEAINDRLRRAAAER